MKMSWRRDCDNPAETYGSSVPGPLLQLIQEPQNHESQEYALTIKLKILFATLLLIAAYFGWSYWLEKNAIGTRQAHAALVKEKLPGEKIETQHYVISSTATAEQTELVAIVVEIFYIAYSNFFKDILGNNKTPEKLSLMLYKDRTEFSANNKSSSWAEAYYREPVCYAYYSDKHPNPYHWMVHEATHQLNNELAHFKIPKWINEGLATYFGTSKIQGKQLRPGIIDPVTYPIWWLSSLDLSGDLKTDIDNGNIIPMRFIITGNGGPDINKNVNIYYIHYWSFTHFLFHYKDGLYADSYKQLIVEGGSLESFEKIIGPVNRIEQEWYGYLQQKIIEAGEKAQTQSDDTVEVSI